MSVDVSCQNDGTPTHVGVVVEMSCWDSNCHPDMVKVVVDNSSHWEMSL